MIDITDIIAIAETAGRLMNGVTQDATSGSAVQNNNAQISSQISVYSLIANELSRLAPEISIAGKPASSTDKRPQIGPLRYWLVTPAQEMEDTPRARTEAAICIALIENGRPALGVVHVPKFNTTYWGCRSRGAFKSFENRISELRVNSARSHDVGVEFQLAMSQPKITPHESSVAIEHHDSGDNTGSLKLCLILDGGLELDSHFATADDADIAAGHAVFEAAGGQVLTWPKLEFLNYTNQSRGVLIVCATIGAVPFKSEESLGNGIVYERRDNDSKAEVIWHTTQVTTDMRAASLNQKPKCIWLTGLSGSGKSTIANSLELCLYKGGKHTFLLDGDNVRQGLNRDLGMTSADRAENIRRVGEVAKLMVEAGMIVVTAFISPFRDDRNKVRSLFEDGEFLEVFVDTSLEECERRDVKGLYAKARRGELKDFTGIDSSYEPPIKPDVHLFPEKHSLQECVLSLIDALENSPPADRE